MTSIVPGLMRDGLPGATVSLTTLTDNKGNSYVGIEYELLWIFNILVVLPTRDAY